MFPSFLSPPNQLSLSQVQVSGLFALSGDATADVCEKLDDCSLTQVQRSLPPTSPANNSRQSRARTVISKHLGLRRCQQRLYVGVILGNHDNPCKPS